MTDQIITIEMTGGIAVMTLNISEITLDLSETLTDDVTALADQYPGLIVVLDLAALKFLGSLALTTLIILQKRLRQTDGRLIIAGLAGQPMSVMKLMRITTIIEHHPDVPSALATIEPQS